VPAYVQVSACFFLACCLLALPAKSSDQEGASEGVSSSALKRKSFLTVIDSKIGLNRFTETLKKPLLTSRKPTTSVDNFFFIPDFRAFYETQVQNVKDVIFEMYSGVDGNTSGVEGLHLQMINLQKAKIQELEEKLRDLQGKAGSSETSTAEDLQRLKTILHEKEEELTAFQTASESLNLQLQESAQTLEHEVTMTDALRTEVKELQQALNERESAMQEMIASNESLLQQHREEADGWRLREERYEEEILSLKEGILKEASLRRSLEESVEQKDKKIFLLESELTELQEAHPSELAQLSEARHKITTLDEQAQQLRSEVTLWQRRCEQLQEELQLLSAQATVVSVANEINDEREARAKTLKEAIALLQSELDTKTKEWAIAVEENAELQEKLELAITPGHLAVSSEPSKNESDKSLAHHLLTKQLREHLSRLSQEIIDTNESIGDLPAGVGDDGDEEHEAADEADIDPDERLLVRAIHKLQNLRLAISFVAGECSQIYEGLNLPMEKLVGAEGTLGRCYEVVLELKDMYLQQGNQLCIDVDKLKASLEEYEQKFKELEEDKSSKLSSPDTKDSTSFSDSLEREVQRLKEKILELEGSVEDWQGHAEENAAEARHWRAYADELQHQVEASRHHHHQPATVEAAVVAVDGDVDKDNVQVSSTLEDLQATVLRLQEQLLEQDKVGHETLSSERSIWQQAEVLLKSEISRLQEQLSLLQAEGDKHRDSHSVLNHLRGKLAALEEELENERSRAHNEVANKETLIAQYQEDIEGKEKLLKSSQVEIVGLQDKLIRAQQELQRTEDTISQLTVATEQQQSSLQSELTSLREQLAAALAEATAVANTNDDAKFQLEAEIASLTATKLQLEAQVESVSAQLEAEKQLVLTLEGDISLAQVRIHGMSQESAGWQQEIHDLKAQILSIDAARHHLQEEAQGVLMAMKNQFDSIVHKTELQLATTSDSIVSLIDLKDRWSLLFSALERQHAETTKSLQHSLQMEVEKSKDLEQSIVVLEESNNEKIALLEQKNAHIMDLAGQLADKDERITHLMEVHEQERQARKELPPMPIFNNTVQLQDVEIRRLNTTVERLTKEIKQKEQENLTFKPLIMKRDGEIALLKDQLEMLQAASARLQKENDQLTLKVEDSDRQIRDKPVVLHNVAHSTVGRFAEYNVLPTSERMQVTEAMHLLHDFMLLTNEKHHIPDYFKTEINRDLTTQDLPDLVLALKRSLQEIIGKMDAEIDGFVKILAEKDKELAMFKAALVAANHSSRNGDSGSSSVNQSINNSVLMASPVRPSPPGSERRRLLRSAEKTPVKDESSFVTPLKTPSSREPKINSESRLASDWTGGSVDRLGGRRSVTVTPSAKEAARYHAELIRERKRLVVLQEEHADLLGLIAQQEVEISVFREKLHKLLGQDVETVEREARDNVEKQYGVYTNFRDMADA
jgi:chromosome segregation ATPase